ncbi:chemotaxis protein MotD [Rhizobium subbaraonis]|uniref:Chemotaxis protein MotD n=1 Tax=Rhizobium subbaraonis TaxID=908946 RepID=A0A285UUB1_9HYPH|nr:flagellar hook-length control protein FliK [Rhizobium subbaraonis]SOC45393.1 chemotaxis protein MotD [Rhizobium subbaraonis]
MSSIDTNIVSQLDSKRSFGAAKSTLEGAGGKFSETFDTLSGKGGAKNSITREAILDGVVKAGSDALPSLASVASIQDRFAADAGKQEVQAPLPGTVADASDTGEAVPAEAAADGLSGADIAALVAETKGMSSRPADDRKGPPARSDADGGYDGLLNILAGTPANAEPAQNTDLAQAAASVVAQGAQQQVGDNGGEAAKSVTTGVAELMLANVPARAIKGGETGDAASGRVRAQSTLADATRGAAAAGMAPDAIADAPVAADDVAGSDADQVFRLVRSDGRARPVEIAIGGNGDVAVKEQGTPAAKIEAVTVLDSRRYLGLAPTGNASAVTSAIAHDPTLASALTAAQDDKTGKVVNTLKIQLSPIDLGTVTATLRLQGEALTVDLKVETGKAYRNLSDDQDAIIKALRGHGFAVDQVSVQLTSSSDRSGSTGQGDPQAQFSGQQQAREGGGQQQGGNAARQADTKAFNEGTSYDYGQADGSSVANQSRGSGGVYL